MQNFGYLPVVKLSEKLKRLRNKRCYVEVKIYSEYVKKTVHGSKIKETIIAITQFDITISPNGLFSSCRNNCTKQVKNKSQNGEIQSVMAAFQIEKREKKREIQFK